MKHCPKCRSVLDAEMFYKSSASKDGLFWICKKCAIINALEYQKQNKDRISQTSKIWRQRNKEKCLEAVRKWRKLHPEAATIRVIEWQKKNPEKVKKHYEKWRMNNQHVRNSFSAARRAKCKYATPKWANSFFIKEIYHLAKLRSKATGIKWHVDHIIPLNGRNVCGLHVETNLQVIPWADNVRKGNRF